MININSVYERVSSLVAKQQGGGYLSADEFNEYANMASLQLLNDLFSRFQNTEKITDMTKAFIANVVIPVNNFGRANYPSDYRYMLTAPRTYDKDSFNKMIRTIDIPTPQDYAALPQQDLKVIDNDKLGNRMTSGIFKPTDDLPICTLYDDYVQIRPFNVGYMILDYLKAPAVAKWGFIIDPQTGLQVYDPLTSVDFDWSPVAENQLVAQIVRLFSVQVRETELTQTASVIEPEE